MRGIRSHLFRRLLASIVIVLVAAVPAALVAYIWNPAGFGVVMLSVVVAAASVASTNLRTGIVAVSSLLLLTPIALVASQLPLAGACEMAVMCLIAGASAIWGMHVGLTLVTINVAFLLPATRGMRHGLLTIGGGPIRAAMAHQRDAPR
jgi:hypothetical protein